MTLTYVDFETATGISLPATADDRLPSTTSVTNMITDITTGEFEEITDVTFSETTASHKRLLWKLVQRRIMVQYRRLRTGSTVSRQTPAGSITYGDSLGSISQLNDEINILANQINLHSSSMITGGGYQ